MTDQRLRVTVDGKEYPIWYTNEKRLVHGKEVDVYIMDYKNKRAVSSSFSDCHNVLKEIIRNSVASI